MAVLKYKGNIVSPVITKADKWYGAKTKDAAVLPSANSDGKLVAGGSTEPFSVTFTGVTDMDYRVLMNKFSGSEGIEAIHCPDLEELNGESAMENVAINAPNFTTFTAPKLRTIHGGRAMVAAFAYTNVKRIEFPALQEIWYLGLSSLCRGCSDVELFFPALTYKGATRDQNCLENIFGYGATNCSMHFPVSLEGVITAMPTYPDFGGTGTQTFFDLPDVETFYTFTVNAPEGSVVYINGEERENNTIKVVEGSDPVLIEVECPGFYPYTTDTYVYEDTVFNITEDDLPRAFSTISMDSSNNFLDRQDDRIGNGMFENNFYVDGDRIRTIPIGTNAYMNATGYIMIKPTENTTLSIDCEFTSGAESNWGCIYVSPKYKFYPNMNQIMNEMKPFGDDEGQYLARGTDNGYREINTMELEAGKTYYVSFTYRKTWGAYSDDDHGMFIYSINSPGLAQYQIQVDAPAGCTTYINDTETSTLTVPDNSVNHIKVINPNGYPFELYTQPVHDNMTLSITEDTFPAAFTSLNLTADNNFGSDDSRIQQYILNKGFHIVNGAIESEVDGASQTVKKGLIVLKPETDVVLTVNARVSSEEGGDMGAVYIGEGSDYSPNFEQLLNGEVQNGRYLFLLSGETTAQDYTTTLNAGTTYFIGIMYSNDWTVRAGDDRIYINSITTMAA